jgi:hypothetical protein
MRLNIIKYNIFFKIRKVFIGLIIVFFLILVILYKKPIRPGLIYLILIFIMLSWGILYFVFIPYEKKGSIILNLDRQCLIEIENKQEIINLQNIVFYYGGYAGEAYPIKYIPTFSAVRDGTQNYIMINNIKYQVLINSKEDWMTILSFIDKMNNMGIQSNWVRMTFLETLRFGKQLNT